MPTYYKPYRVALGEIPARARVALLLPSAFSSESARVQYSLQSHVDTDLPAQWRTFSRGLIANWGGRAGNVRLVEKKLQGLGEPTRYTNILTIPPRGFPVTPAWNYRFDPVEVRRLAAEVQADILIAPVYGVTNQLSTDVYFPFELFHYCRGVPASSVFVGFMAFDSSGELLAASPDFPSWKGPGVVLNEAVDVDGVRCRSRAKFAVSYDSSFSQIKHLDEVIR